MTADGLPWWVFAALGFLAVEYHIADISSGALQGLDSAADEAPKQQASLRASSRNYGLQITENTRMLGAKHAGDAQDEGKEGRADDEGGDKGKEGKANDKGKEADDKGKEGKDDKSTEDKVNIYVNIPCFRTLIEPCGNVTVPYEGVFIKTPFGKEHLPGAKDIKPDVEKTEEFMSRYTVYIVLIGIAVWILKTVLVASNRERMVKSAREILAGQLDDDDDLDEDEQAQKKADAMDPKSEDFIAPGNIFRMLAVLHPGIIGYTAWIQYAFKGIVSSYMQLYVPYRILAYELETWHYVGVKSPLWFLSNGSHFASMMAALLSLCQMFAGKCGNNITAGARANFHILTHKTPAGYKPPPAAKAGGSQGGYHMIVPIALPQPPPLFIALNEYFWCSLSMVINILMSFLLQLAMFIKVATFTGAVGQVAIIALSLYFVFDLDKKVLDGDDKLKLKYRKAVLTQTEEREYKPNWLPTMAMSAASLLQFSVPFGFIAIVLFSFKNTENGIVIGGDGL